MLRQLAFGLITRKAHINLITQMRGVLRTAEQHESVLINYGSLNFTQMGFQKLARDHREEVMEMQPTAPQSS